MMAWAIIEVHISNEFSSPQHFILRNVSASSQQADPKTATSTGQCIPENGERQHTIINVIITK